MEVIVKKMNNNNKRRYNIFRDPRDIMYLEI